MLGNLLANALDALSEKAPPRRIWISAEVTAGGVDLQLRDKARRLRQEVKLGEYAMEDDVAAPGRGPQLEQDRAASGPDLDQELT